MTKNLLGGFHRVGRFSTLEIMALYPALTHHVMVKTKHDSAERHGKLLQLSLQECSV